jgi:hypothetical protein
LAGDGEAGILARIRASGFKFPMHDTKGDHSQGRICFHRPMVDLEMFGSARVNSNAHGSWQNLIQAINYDGHRGFPLGFVVDYLDDLFNSRKS